MPLGEQEKSHLISINDATVQKDFYTLDRNDDDPSAFEATLASVEASTVAAFTHVIDDQIWPPSESDRLSISTWIALQYLRTASVRSSSEYMYRSIAKLEVGVFTTAQIRTRLGLSDEISDADVEHIRARMLATADSFEVDHYNHLQQIIEELEGFTRLVHFRRPWVLVGLC